MRARLLVGALGIVLIAGLRCHNDDQERREGADTAEKHVSESGKAEPDPSAPWPNRRITQSSLQSGLTIDELNRCANDAALARATRCKAVFTLFANHVEPGAGVDQMAKVILDPSWLRGSDLASVDIAGWGPVELGVDRELFALHVLPVGLACPDWLVYFTLSGNSHDAREAAAFLKGEPGVARGLKMLEFALCFPDGRIERFSSKGIVLYDLSDVPRALYKPESRSGGLR